MSSFGFVGGRLALDFVNIVGGIRPERPKEGLHTYADLVGWARAAGLVDARLQAKLFEEARLHPRRAQAALEQAIAVREAFHGVVAAAIAHEEVPQAALDEVNRWIAEAQSKRQFRPARGGGFEQVYADDGDPLSFLRPVALSAAQVLADDCALGRVRICAEREFDRCGWVFVDETKNHSRRFCSMADCGNRAKQRRFQERQRKRA